jgi:hypothetical protein
VRWDRLGHVLTCRGCSRLFRVGGGGQLVEVIRDPDGKWVERGSRQDPRSRPTLRRRVLYALPLAVLLLVLVAGLGTWRSRAAFAALPELPKDLETRADLLARAWLQRDVPLMRRLTVATHERIVYSWYVRHQPPPLAADALTSENRPMVQIAERKGRWAQAVLRLPGGGDSTRAAVELRLWWEQRGDTWFFVPPDR